MVVLLPVIALRLRRRSPLVSFAIIWWFGNLAIESSVIGLELVFEHRTYLPGAFLSLMIVVLVFDFLRNNPRLRFLFIIGVLILLACWTYDRNRLWADDVALWRDAAVKSPAKPRTHLNLGIVLEDHGNSLAAVTEYRRALDLGAEPHEVYYNLGNGRYSRAESAYRRALEANPHDMDARLNLGVALEYQGEYREAAGLYTSMLTERPVDPRLHNNLGNALQHLGDLRRAADHYEQALALRADYADARYNLGLVYFRWGRFTEAAGQLRTALALEPGDADVHYYLGEIAPRRQRYAEAARQFKTALRLSPGHTGARRALRRLEMRNETGNAAGNDALQGDR